MAKCRRCDLEISQCEYCRGTGNAEEMGYCNECNSTGYICPNDRGYWQ